jgi:hypothetical protein
MVVREELICHIYLPKNSGINALSFSRRAIDCCVGKPKKHSSVVLINGAGYYKGIVGGKIVTL